MTERLRRRPTCRDPRQRPTGAARRRASTTSSRPASDGVFVDNPVLATVARHPRPTTTGSATAAATPSSSEIADDRAHLATVESLDPDGLSPEARFERDLEIHNLRLVAVRCRRGPQLGARASTAAGTIGDALFLLFARDHAPLSRAARRASPAASRPSPTYLDGAQTRPSARRSGSGRRSRSRRRGPAGPLRRDRSRRPTASSPAAELPPRMRARSRRRQRPPSTTTAAGCARTLADGNGRLAARPRALRRARRASAPSTASTPTRSSSIGWEQLAEEPRGRAAAAAREIDPDADEPTVIDRVKSDHPATFDGGARRPTATSMRRARAPPHRSRPRDDPGRRARSRSSRRPEYLRNVMPFAAYFEPARFDDDQAGIYIVTPVGRRRPERDARAQLRLDQQHQHPRGVSRATTSSSTLASRHPSLTRLLTDAPEFVEGWGMYSRADDARAGLRRRPGASGSIMHTDAIWRACRIILDVRMHRGELTVEEATDFLVEHTAFERAERPRRGPAATRTRPTYQLCYLLGKVLLLGLREDEQRRLGDGVRLQGVPRHAAAQRLAARSASTAGCCAGERRLTRRASVIPAIDLEAGRSRVVYWPGAAAGIGAPDRPAGADRRAVRRPGRPAPPPRRLRRRAEPASPANLEAVGAVAARVARPAPGRRRRWRRPTTIRLAFAAGATRVVARDGHRRAPGRRCAQCLAVAGDWLAVGLDPRPERIAAFPWRRPRRRRPSTPSSGSSSEPASRRFVLSHGGADAGPRAARLARPRRTMRTSSSPAASATSTGVRRLRDAGVAGVILGEALLSGAIDFPWPWRPPHDQTHPIASVTRVAVAGDRGARARRGMLVRGSAAPRPSRPPARPSAAAPHEHRAPSAGVRRPTARPRSPSRSPAGETRTVTIDDRPGRHRDRARGVDLSPDRGRQLRRARRVRLLRRRRVPPRDARLRHPGRRRAVRPLAGRRPDARRHRRPAVHDPGRAGHRDLRAAAPSRWPALGSPNSRRLAVLHRPRRRAPSVARVREHVPDHRHTSRPGMEAVDAIAAAAAARDCRRARSS